MKQRIYYWLPAVASSLAASGCYVLALLYDSILLVYLGGCLCCVAAGLIRALFPAWTSGEKLIAVLDSIAAGMLVFCVVLFVTTLVFVPTERAAFGSAIVLGAGLVIAVIAGVVDILARIVLYFVRRMNWGE